MAKKQAQPQRPFMNLSVHEMAAQVQQREAQLNRRNGLILALFFALLAVCLTVGAIYYGGWLLRTLDAAWQVVSSIWHLQWWQAGAILFEYKLSFFILGIVVGFIVFLFIAFEIGEMLVEWGWDWVSSWFD